VNVVINFGAKLILFFDIASYLQKNMYLCSVFAVSDTIFSAVGGYIYNKNLLKKDETHYDHITLPAAGNGLCLGSVGHD
jgi:hypothetical protein